MLLANSVLVLEGQSGGLGIYRVGTPRGVCARQTSSRGGCDNDAKDVNLGLSIQLTLGNILEALVGSHDCSDVRII